MRSVQKALQFIGAPCEISADAGKIARASGVILPGVGAFGGCMEQLHRRGLAQPVRTAALEAMQSKRPFLGICLGMQLLFAASQESPGVQGLDVLPGTVTRIPRTPEHKVPHMGWNSVELLTQGGLFAGVPQGAYFYFVHSYYVRTQRPEHAAARTQYGVSMDAAAAHGLLFAAQFHPEKSGSTGLILLRNFLEMSK